MNIKNKKRNSKVWYTSKITQKFQTTMPKEIRKHLNIEIGDEIVFELLLDGTVIIRKFNKMLAAVNIKGDIIQPIDVIWDADQ